MAVLYLMLPASHSEALGEPHRPCILMSNELPISLAHQTAVLLLLAVPVACASWTVTHEEVFREPREYCKRKSEHARALPQRKFFYLFTCEYCFSHYMAALALPVFHFQLLFSGWRGYLVAWFALVWIANVYMSFFNRLRLDIKHENVAIAVEQTALPPHQPKS
jgi:hypothetical protein